MKYVPTETYWAISALLRERSEAARTRAQSLRNDDFSTPTPLEYERAIGAWAEASDIYAKFVDTFSPESIRPVAVAP